MRKYSVMILIALMVVALGSVACSSTDKSLDESLTPEGMLAAALEETTSLEQGSGEYEIEVTLDTEGGQGLTDEMEMFGALLGGPITVSGTFAGKNDPILADVTIDAGVSVLQISAAIRAADEQAWLMMMDQWYEAPDELQELLDPDNEMPEELKALIEETDFAAGSWTSDLTREADETIAGAETVHLSGTLDVGQIIDDVFEFTQQPEVAEMAGDLTGEAEDLSSMDIPGGAFEFASIKAIIETMIQDNTVDVWIAKADSSVRKIVLTADVIFPPEADMEGISGMTLVITVTLDEPGTKVEVEAPESAKSFEELETDLQNSPIFGPLLEGLMGGSTGSDGLLGF